VTIAALLLGALMVVITIIAAPGGRPSQSRRVSESTKVASAPRQPTRPAAASSTVSHAAHTPQTTGPSAPTQTQASVLASQPKPAGPPLSASAIVPGHCIGPAALGEDRRKLTADLVGRGYTATPGSSSTETVFRSTSNDGVVVVGFNNNGANYIQKYGDDTIAINGVSISSTLRQAQSALPKWRSIRCPSDNYNLLVAPDGHTYFELPLTLDATNDAGANGIVVAATIVSSCQ
jgi:hypothetical protein